MMREKARERRKKTTQRCKRKREGGKEKRQKKREREREGPDEDGRREVPLRSSWKRQQYRTKINVN